MSEKLNIHTVYNREREMWENKDKGNVLSSHHTQENATERAGKMGRANPAGAELSIHRKDNAQIREKNTIPPANDPRSTKG